MSINVENLTISIPSYGCNKSCPYCISGITKNIPNNIYKWNNNLKKARNMAMVHYINSVLITGKGEPLINLHNTLHAIDVFSDFPLELQTNGLILKNNLPLLETLNEKCLDTISISMDFLQNNIKEQLDDFSTTFEYNKKYTDINIRLAINITSHTPKEYRYLEKYIDLCKEYNVGQLIIRNISVPTFNVNEESKQYKWIIEDLSKGSEPYKEFVYNAQRYLKDSFVIRETTYGAKIYDLYDISFVFSDYCIQESNLEDGKKVGIRSLIYQQDGHMYTSWNSLASRLF